MKLIYLGLVLVIMIFGCIGESANKLPDGVATQQEPKSFYNITVPVYQVQGAIYSCYDIKDGKFITKQNDTDTYKDGYQKYGQYCVFENYNEINSNYRPYNNYNMNNCNYISSSTYEKIIIYNNTMYTIRCFFNEWIFDNGTNRTFKIAIW